MPLTVVAIKYPFLSWRIETSALILLIYYIFYKSPVYPAATVKYFLYPAGELTIPACSWYY
ncbi:hypothetical protein HMPREF0080_00692 [Anaeroglobus geminatus F0357]|uniref:Uncharacterized protein n=1 Tax=Anaeroglobus geminatus F0357 TaxID=861450 RepID=G9YGC7_9FIRM|nr:hypothetical protein HMPREF0080_00692 [Anaeroglobus geminatus F0357]